MENKTWIVRECVECGRRSAPWFGFAAPCRARAGGGHGETIAVEVSQDEAAKLLWAAFQGCPTYDAQRFWTEANPEQRQLLARHGA